MRKFFILIIGLLFVTTVNADIIDIIEGADGRYSIIADGDTHMGQGLSRNAAEKVSKKLGANGNTINWKSFQGGGTGNSGSTQTVSSGAQTGLNVGKNGAYSRTNTIDANGNTVYEEHNFNTGKTAYRDPKTGQYVKANPQKQLTSGSATNSGQKLLSSHTDPKALPEYKATQSVGTRQSEQTSQPKQTGQPKNNTSPKATSATPKVNAMGLAMGVVGVASGAVGLYDSVSDTSRKATWNDVGQGAMSGATVAAGGAAIVNAIPVGGQIAYGVSMAVGAVIGTMGAGARMFSETDCDMDPVTGQYACCNISNLSNIDARRVGIGDEMFCEFPMVKKCMQGKFETEQPWLKGRFLDDHWSATCETKFCSGYDAPEAGDWNIQLYGASESAGKVCWKWECADDGMVRRGGRCENNIIELDAVVITANAIKAGDACPTERLPQYATAGKYIKSGKNPDTGLDKFVCAATACKDGTYLVRNERGESQGWCRAGTAPVQTMGNTDNVNGNTENITPDSDLGNSETEISQTVAQNKCEAGDIHYVMFEGQCILIETRDKILSERVAAENQIRQNISSAQANIKSAYNVIKNFKADIADELTVWKNAEGKFNTTRLASDSVAGVVLGTAGGLITSSVIKKNQIKNGFDDIQCVIGNQVVAGFGDEFNVKTKY